MNQKILKLAVLTDLHAYASLATGSGEPSWLCISKDQSNPVNNPFAGLIKIIPKEKLSADVVICCGDLSDKAQPEAQQYVWKEINRLKGELGAKLVIGAAGNHDVDSRHIYNNFDAKGQLQSLSPRFPIDDEIRWLEYWAKNFTLYYHEDVRFLLLNTAAYHGGGKDQKEEFEHGRVSESTIERILSSLNKDGPRLANILVCHHHPYKNDKINVDDYSEIKGADVFLNKLAASDFGPWLVIHGHKHLPRIFHGPGGNMSPTIFSAGSFSARLYAEYQGSARNEFYIVDLVVPAEHTTSLRGKINAWQWTYGNGWGKPKERVGLGLQAAFGARVDLGILAKNLAESLKVAYSGKAVDWMAVTGMNDDIGFLIPEDLEHLLKILRNHNIRAMRDDESGLIVEVQVS